MAFISTYEEISQSQHPNIRALLRKLALDSLGLKASLLAENRLLSRPRVQIIYVHHVFDDEKDDFRRAVEFFARFFSFISYTEAVEKILTNDIDRPYMAFSSDDGFKNNLNAAEILESFGTSACFFVNPGSIAMSEYQSVHSFCRDKLNLPPIEFLDWNDLQTLKKGGHEIGCHSMWHENLGAIAPEDVRHDLIQSKSKIESECGEVKHFAFPYGRWCNFNGIGLEIVWEVGYRSCASAERGCHLPSSKTHPDKLVLRRDHFIAQWPTSHMLYFFSKNISQSTTNQHHPWK